VSFDRKIFKKNLLKFLQILTKLFIRYGANCFPPPKIKSLWEVIFDNFDDFINKVLLVAAVVSMAIGLYQH
jgi:magnesium-transporting ATPase (P-type)